MCARHVLNQERASAGPQTQGVRKGAKAGCGCPAQDVREHLITRLVHQGRRGHITRYLVPGQMDPVTTRRKGQITDTPPVPPARPAVQPDGPIEHLAMHPHPHDRWVDVLASVRPALHRADADTALADTEAIEHIERIFDPEVMEREARLARDWEAMRVRLATRAQRAKRLGRAGPRVPPPWTKLEPHKQESLLIGTAIRLATKAQRCAGSLGCANDSGLCRRNRDKGHCLMRTLLERVDDLEQLYGPSFAERVSERLRQVGPMLTDPAPLLVASRVHTKDVKSRLRVRQRILSGDPPTVEEIDDNHPAA